jgi:hypothetical protein
MREVAPSQYNVRPAPQSCPHLSHFALLCRGSLLLLVSSWPPPPSQGNLPALNSLLQACRLAQACTVYANTHLEIVTMSHQNATDLGKYRRWGGIIHFGPQPVRQDPEGLWAFSSVPAGEVENLEAMPSCLEGAGPRKRANQVT